MESWDLYEMLSPIVLLIITVVSAFLTKYIHEKTKNATLAGMLGRLNEIIWDEVRAAEQVAVAGIKAAKSPSSDGGVKVTKAEGDKIRRDVLDRIKENFGMAGLQKLGKILGLGGKGMAKMIEAKVEATVLSVGANP